MPVKIIDEKGKIFGKVNIIDLLVILLVIAVAALFAYRKVSQALTSPDATPAKVTYVVRASNVDVLAYEAIRDFVDAETGKTDQLFSSDSNNKLLDGYITDCIASPHVEYVATDDGEIKRVESSGDDQRLDLFFTIEAQVEDIKTNKVGTQQVRVGASHYIKTTHFEMFGYVMDMDWEILDDSAD